MAIGLTASLSLALAAPSNGAPEVSPEQPAVPPVVPPTAPQSAAAATVHAPVPAADPSLGVHEMRQARMVTKRAAFLARVAQIRKVRAKVVSVARNQVGDTYTAGGNGPDNFDCSGLTQYVFKVAAGKDLPHQSRAQFAKVRRVSKAKAQPGDLVFFFRNGAHHVGVYIGKGKMIDARGYGKGVKVSPISGSWWGRSFSGIGRILPSV